MFTRWSSKPEYYLNNLFNIFQKNNSLILKKSLDCHGLNQLKISKKKKTLNH